MHSVALTHSIMISSMSPSSRIVPICMYLGRRPAAQSHMYVFQVLPVQSQWASMPQINHRDNKNLCTRRYICKCIFKS